MESEREITFVNIPMEIFCSKKLTPAEKHLYGWLSIFKKQCCFMSNAALAQKTGLSEPTITRALNSLQKSGYVFVEYTNGDNHKRRIYTIFDNPQKIRYLAKKGLLDHCSSNQNDSNQNDEMDNPSNQNDEVSNQNDEMKNPCSSNQNDEHIIIKDNKKIGELSGSAGNEPAGQLKPKREDFPNTKVFLKALKNFNEEVGKNDECESTSLSKIQEILD